MITSTRQFLPVLARLYRVYYRITNLQDRAYYVRVVVRGNLERGSESVSEPPVRARGHRGPERGGRDAGLRPG